MLSRITALAVLAMRAAVRSRVFVSTMVALCVMIVWVPLNVRGDGTAAGQARILIHYTLALALVVAGTGAVWTSCSAVSQEIESGEIRLVAVKPVRAFEVWAGKWLGLMALNSLLLLLTAAVLCVFLFFLTRSSWGGDGPSTVRERVLTPRRMYEPVSDAVTEEAFLDEFTRLREEGEIQPGVTPESVREPIMQRIMARRAAVGPGESKHWTINVPAGAMAWAGERRKSFIGFRVASASWAGRVHGEWKVSSPAADGEWTVPATDYADGYHMIDLPGSLLPDGGAVVVTYLNGSRDESDAAVFSGKPPVALLVPSGAFAASLARTLAGMLSLLAVLTALGLCAGTIFSFPVAAFASFSMVLIFLLGRYQGASSEPLPPDVGFMMAFAEGVGLRMARVVNMVGGPVFRAVTIAQLADGLAVPVSRAVLSVLFLAGLYPTALGAAASLILSRRELGERGK
ncbi:MAG: hypothetical protein FJ224_04290 [Lentisphaerae bacterium]|nr:hypothetical protein [Lentisphaerota bacterium]